MPVPPWSSEFGLGSCLLPAPMEDSSDLAWPETTPEVSEPAWTLVMSLFAPGTWSVGGWVEGGWLAGAWKVWAAAFPPPKPTSINAAASPNDDFEYLISHPFLRVGESTGPAVLSSENPKRKVGIALFGPAEVATRYSAASAGETRSLEISLRADATQSTRARAPWRPAWARNSLISGDALRRPSRADLLKLDQSPSLPR